MRLKLAEGNHVGWYMKGKGGLNESVMRSDLHFDKTDGPNRLEGHKCGQGTFTPVLLHALSK